jgi:hypothetical protein
MGGGQSECRRVGWSGSVFLFLLSLPLSLDRKGVAGVATGREVADESGRRKTKEKEEGERRKRKRGRRENE